MRSKALASGFELWWSGEGGVLREGLWGRAGRVYGGFMGLGSGKGGFMVGGREGGF